MSEKRKTIVILTPGFPKDEQDNTCMPFLQDYLNSFTRLYPNITIKVIAFQYPFKKGHYKWNGIDIYSAGGNTKYLNRLFIWNRVYKELKRFHKENNIMVIHSFWLTECTMIAQRFCKKTGIKHVAYAIGQDVLKGNRYLSLLDFSSIQVVAMSKSLAENLKALTGYNVKHMIASGLNMAKVEASNNKRDIDIIGVGALSPLKNYALFIEIIGMIKKDLPNIKACIIGRGEQEISLKEKIKIEGLKDNVQLIGEVSHKDVFSYLNRSKIFLHTSSYEGQSTVISEALACGLNVICFDVGRIDVEEKIHVCKDKEGMTKQLKKLLSSELTYKPALHRTADDMVRDFMKVYEA